MIEQLEILLAVVLAQIDELYSFNPYSEEDEPETAVIEHCDHISLSEFPSIKNPSYSNGVNEWKALDSKLIEFHQVPERDGAYFKMFLIQSIFIILRWLLDIFGTLCDISTTRKYCIKDERIFLRLKLLIEELGLDKAIFKTSYFTSQESIYKKTFLTTTPLFSSYTTGDYNFIEVLPFRVETIENSKTFLNNCYDVDEEKEEEEKTKLRTISFLSYGIANGKSSTLASFGSLDNGFSAFFRYKFEDGGVFMLKKYYPIFVHLGLLCKAFHLIKFKSSVGIVSRNWVDHSFFAAIEGRENYFTLKYYQHLFSHTVAARNYEDGGHRDVFFRMVTLTDDTFLVGDAGKVMINESSISCENIRFPFDGEDKKITEGRLMENETFKTEQDYHAYMENYRFFFEAAMQQKIDATF